MAASTGIYAMDWYSISGSYDFMRSSNLQLKPVIDTEWHTISTVSFRQPIIPYAYMQACMWLATTHGLGLSQIWYWGRGTSSTASGLLHAASDSLLVLACSQTIGSPSPSCPRSLPEPTLPSAS